MSHLIADLLAEIDQLKSEKSALINRLNQVLSKPTVWFIHGPDELTPSEERAKGAAEVGFIVSELYCLDRDLSKWLY